MDYVKLQKKGTIYSLQDSNQSNLNIVALFLTDEIGSGWKSFMSWINNPNVNKTGGNITWLDKQNNKIIIGFLYSEDEDPYKNAFTLSKDEFIRLIEIWGNLYK